MISTRIVTKTNLLNEIVSELTLEKLQSAIDFDKSISVLEKIKFRKIVSGYKQNNHKYKNLSENNIDYFIDLFSPILEANPKKYISDSNQFCEMLKNLNGAVDKNRVTESLVEAFNESYHTFKKKYPEFDYNDQSTLTVYEGVAYKELITNIMEMYDTHANLEPFSFDKFKENISEKKSSGGTKKSMASNEGVEITKYNFSGQVDNKLKFIVEANYRNIQYSYQHDASGTYLSNEDGTIYNKGEAQYEAIVPFVNENIVGWVNKYGPLFSENK